MASGLYKLFDDPQALEHDDWELADWEKALANRTKRMRALVKLQVPAVITEREQAMIDVARKNIKRLKGE